MSDSPQPQTDPSDPNWRPWEGQPSHLEAIFQHFTAEIAKLKAMITPAAEVMPPPPPPAEEPTDAATTG
jgi:hypothetical protein